MLRILGFFAFLALAACATDSGYSQRELLRGICVEGPGQAYLGQPATAENGELVKAETRARQIRWVAPGQMIAMDHSTERVNIYYGPNRKITQITCG